MATPDKLTAAYEGVEIELPISQAPPSLVRLTDIWRAKRGGEVLPPRAAFTFDDLVPWLGYVHIIERVGDDFAFRIFGSAVATWLGYDFTGRRLSDIALHLPTVAEKALAGYRQTLATAAPVFLHTTQARHRGASFGWSRLLLPLGEGTRATHLLVAVYYQP
jgi:hypothetical protein